MEDYQSLCVAVMMLSEWSIYKCTTAVTLLTHWLKTTGMTCPSERGSGHYIVAVVNLWLSTQLSLLSYSCKLIKMLCGSVCLDIKQGGTNHDHCTQTLVHRPTNKPKPSLLWPEPPPKSGRG